jgi:hypothetical protein
MQVAERGSPAPRGQLPGPVYHVPLQNGPQGWPFRLQQRLRGQAFGLNSTGMMTGQGLIPPVAGGLAAISGAGPAMAAAGAVTILAALLLRGPLTGRAGSAAEVGAAVDVDDLPG